MARTLHPPRARRGFTLVELLVVITIIGILAGLITTAAFYARQSARRAMIKSEISQLEMALENFKTRFNDYPPDFSNVGPSVPDAQRLPARAAVIRFLRRAFPRFALQGSTVDAQFNYFANLVATNYGIDPSQFDSASALVFWLGGLPNDPTLSWVPAGFHADPTNPFKTGGPRIEPFFPFAAERLAAPSDVTGLLRYYPRDKNGAPYVYFRGDYDTTAVNSLTYSNHYMDFTSTAYTNSTSPNPAVQSARTTVGIAVPYVEPNPTPGSSATYAWRDSDRRPYQIISASLDETFGAGAAATTRVSRTGEGFTDGDFDNLASFAENTLENEIK